MVQLILGWYISANMCRRSIISEEGNLQSVPVIYPEASILLICYINDHPTFWSKSKPCIYAHDTALICIEINLQTAESKLQHDFNVLSEWFQSNKLSVRVLSVQRQNVQELWVQPNAEWWACRIYMWYQIPKEKHVNAICGKVNICKKLMWCIQLFVPPSLTKTLYTALVYYKFILEGTHEFLKDKLQVHQKKTLCRLYFMLTTTTLTVCY